MLNVQSARKGKMDRHLNVRKTDFKFAIVVLTKLNQLLDKITAEQVWPRNGRLVCARRIAEPVRAGDACKSDYFNFYSKKWVVAACAHLQFITGSECAELPA